MFIHQNLILIKSIVSRVLLYLEPDTIWGKVEVIQRQLFFHRVFTIFFWIILFFVTLHSLLYLIMGLVGHFKKIKPTPSLEIGHEPFVTIQIPTYNEAAAINCAKCCLNFDYPADKMQIIIGDDSDDPEIRAKLDAFKKEYSNRITINRRGTNYGLKSGNLNSMLKISKGNYIAVFDSDFLPKPDFLRKLLYPLVHDKTLCLTQARWRLHNLDQNLFSVLGGTVSSFSHYAALPFFKAIGGNCYVGGSGFIIRKSVLEDVGGWMEGTLNEDVELSFELMLKGKRMLFLEDVLIDCEAAFTLKDVYKQQMRWAFGIVSAVKRRLGTILRSKTVNFQDKLSATILATGYVYPILLFLLSMFGILQFIIPNPFYPPLPISALIFNLFIGVIFSSLSMISSAIILFKKENKKLIPKFIFGSLIYGGYILSYVNYGVFKALLGKKMEWFILNKNGNSLLIN
ncbi:MAG: glycosyltransferase [Candidatus Lokiarchaeota archaeon]|nr:glycosyltransferase [Candidatus Harpocratesius repetitus]